ncbi:putative RNA helicase [Helianthus annuus]|nr:putative RNA helicase [Helianthus annuus]
MPKGEDAIIRKKNKSLRKKLRSDSAKVSNRIAAIIAQKKRRQSGKRRMCQGMCFSLPTLEDPFNDKYMNLDSKKTKKVWPSKKDNNLTENGSDASQNKRKANSDHKSNEKNQKKKARVEKESTPSDEKSTKKLNTNISTDVGCPSKFLISCLKTVQDTMRDDKAFERGKHLFFDSWGFEYWRCYTSGKHVLETSGCATMEQIAWIGSTAVDSITKKENDGESFTGPYLLFIVPSQEKAAEVRAVCKPLKAFGIHTVSLHPGASIDHQIQGLKTCEPEFLICTPDRLVELVSMDAVDISGVRSLIIDGLECSSGDAYIDSIKSIQQHISVDPHTVVFCSGLTDAYLPAVSSLLPTPMCRLSRDRIIVNKSAT